MFDYAAFTQIDRLAAAHQRYLDDEAAEQDLQETEEQAISNDPDAVACALENFDNAEWSAMSLLIGKLVSQYQYRGAERDQGILEIADEIFRLGSLAISEQATNNRRKAMRGAA